MNSRLRTEISGGRGFKAERRGRDASLPLHSYTSDSPSLFLGLRNASRSARKILLGRAEARQSERKRRNKVEYA